MLKPNIGGLLGVRENIVTEVVEVVAK